MIVDEDRFLSKPSGISTYSNSEVVLGNSWWNYIGLVCRVYNQHVILGGDFNPESYLLLNRLLNYTKKVYLTGKIALKFSIVANNYALKKFANLNLNEIEDKFIREIIEKTSSSQIYIP